MSHEQAAREIADVFATGIAKGMSSVIESPVGRNWVESQASEWQPLVAAILAKHFPPEPDPDGPVDEEWLRSLGAKDGHSFPLDEGTLELYARPEGGIWSASICVENKARWYGCSHEIYIPEPQSRRDVLNLLKGLKGGGA